MKKIILTSAAMLLGLYAFAQTISSEEYAKRMELLISRVGSGGVGVETILTKWEKDYPDDQLMLSYKFNYHLSKAQSTEVRQKNQERFLGQKPILALKDSLGNDINYFNEVIFDDEQFGIASQTLEKLIKLKPNDLELRFAKITTLIAYEKESPDMASSALKGLIDYNYSSKPAWEFTGSSIDNETFADLIQDVCYSFYTIGSPTSFEAFKSISEKMLGYNPKNSIFYDNVGSYYLAYKKDHAQALKSYNKALKINPADMSAIKNCILISRLDKNQKLEKKYLTMLVNNSTEEIEKASAQARLDAMNKK